MIMLGGYTFHLPRILYFICCISNLALDIKNVNFM